MIGRGKFSEKDILDAELDILQTIGFRVTPPTNMYTEASIKLKHSLMSSKHYITVTNDKTSCDYAQLQSCLAFADRYLLFLCLFVTMTPSLSHISTDVISQALAYLTLKILKRKAT